DSHEACAQWAELGECEKNPAYMRTTCPVSCANPPPKPQEIEQCAGWADQGECTRNPKFMMTSCPRSCEEQRLSIHEGLLDAAADCIDVASATSCDRDPSLQQRCPGSCGGHALCASDADAKECTRALRCRELKDKDAGCERSVRSSGCASSSSRRLLKDCFLSCARHDLNGTLARFRAKISVRTYKFGMIDESTIEQPQAGGSALPTMFCATARQSPLRRPSLPCWKGSVFDQPPAATCENVRAQLLARWRRLAHPRCALLRETTPRPPQRRSVDLPSQLRLTDAAEGGRVGLVPVLLQPKVRLIEGFVSSEEADHVISIGMPKMHRSLAGGRAESIRTSTTAMLPKGDPVVRKITERAAFLTVHAPSSPYLPSRRPSSVKSQSGYAHRATRITTWSSCSFSSIPLARSMSLTMTLGRCALY
ncbi:MAG: hypothetical protein SGPRY_010772, partial [Prymnesium sp.]